MLSTHASRRTREYIEHSAITTEVGAYPLKRLIITDNGFIAGHACSTGSSHPSMVKSYARVSVNEVDGLASPYVSLCESVRLPSLISGTSRRNENRYELGTASRIVNFRSTAFIITVLLTIETIRTGCNCVQREMGDIVSVSENELALTLEW